MLSNKVKDVLIQDMSRQMPNRRHNNSGWSACTKAPPYMYTCSKKQAYPNYLYRYTFMKTPKFVWHIPLKDCQVLFMHMPTMCRLLNKFGNGFLESGIQYFASFINIWGNTGFWGRLSAVIAMIVYELEVCLLLSACKVVQALTHFYHISFVILDKKNTNLLIHIVLSFCHFRV